MTILNVRHTTVYRYRNPVRLGDHRLMLGPRASHDLRLIRTSLILSAGVGALAPRRVRQFDRNRVVRRTSRGTADRESRLTLESYVVEQPLCDIAAEAASYPFIYSADDRLDLGWMLLERQYPDPRDRLDSWARGFVRSNPTDTLALLADLNAGVKASISYQGRETEGTQSRSRRSTAARGRAAISPCC